VVLLKSCPQTRVLLLVRVIGDISEMPESVVGDLDDPATVQHTVGALQTTVKLQLTFVNKFHSLTNSRGKDLLINCSLYGRYWLFTT